MKVDRMISLRTAFTMMGILMFCSLMVRLRLERPGASVSTAQEITYASSYKYIEKHDIYKASKNESYPVCNRLPEILDDILVEEADRGKTRRKYQSMLDGGELHCGNERVYGAAYVFGKKHLSPWRGCIDEIMGAKRRLYDYLHDLCSIQEKHSLYYGSEPFDPLGGKRRYGVVMTGKPHHFKAIYQAILALRNPIYADDPDAKERAWNPRIDVEVWVNQNDMALCEYIFMDSTAAKHIRGGGSDSEGNRTFKSLVGTGDVVCRNLPDKANGFASKFYVLLETFFTDVLFLDSDNIMTRDASEVFNSKAYAQTGAVLWPDLWGEQCARDRGLNNMGSYGYAAYEAHVLYKGHFGGLQWANERAYAQESEAGQVAMNLRRHGGLVHLGWQMIEDQKFFKRVFNGDKDIFRLVHLITGEPFMFVPHYPGYSTQERHGWSRDCLVHFFGPQKENSDSEGPGFGPYSDTKGIWRPASVSTVAGTGSRSWREVKRRRLDGAGATGSAESGENQRALSEDRPGERGSVGAEAGGTKIEKDFWFRFGSGIGSIFTAAMGSTPRSKTQTQTQTQGRQYRIGELNARNLIDEKLRTSVPPSTAGAGAGAGAGAADSDSTYEAGRRTMMKTGASESESESQVATKSKAKAKAKMEEPEEMRMRKRGRGSQDDDVQPAPPSTALPFHQSFPSYYYNPGTNVPMFYHQLKQRDPLAFAMVSRLGDSQHQEAPSACIEMNRVSDKNNNSNSTGSSTHVTLVTDSVEDQKRFVAWSTELFSTVDSNWRGMGAPIRLHYHSLSQTVSAWLAGLFAGSTVPILLLIVIAMVVWSRRAFRRYSLAYSGTYSSGGSGGNGNGNGGGGRGRRRADSVRPNLGVGEPIEGDTSNTSTMKTTMHQSFRYKV